MPKKSLKIDRFEGGVVSFYNPRDIPVNSFVDAQDVMVDVVGKVRLMGRYNVYTPAQTPLANLSAHVKPGHGLFAFSADYNVDGDSIETEMLAIQSQGYVGIFDTELHPQEIALTDETDLGLEVEPNFFYINGALRVSNGYIQNVNADGTHPHDDIVNRWYGYISRTLFSGLATSVDRDLGWTDEPQALATPTTNALQEASPSAGTLSLIVDFADDDSEGEWNATQLEDLTFGYSWLYDDEKQESKLIEFTSNVDVGGSTDRHMRLQVKIDTTFDDVPNRVTGFRIYWMGEGGDTFEDPFQLAEGDFVEGNFTGHNNKVVAFAISGDYYQTPATTSALILPTQPALTFRLVNGYKHDVASIEARYKTSIIANGVAYIGNIRQNGRNYPDRMLKSAIGPDGKGFFDVYPSDNFLDVAVQDGDAITALAESADRLLQFKRKSVSIINISGDFEYVEAHHRYMGVSSQAAVTNTHNGIAWVNNNGAYLFDGEGIQDLTANKIDPIIWKRFIEDKGIIGYLGIRKQLIVSATVDQTSEPQDLYVYDIRTQSWTFGKDKIPNLSKSNFVSDYKATTLFVTNTQDVNESLEVSMVSNALSPTDGIWSIDDPQLYTLSNSTLNINSIPITSAFSYDYSDTDSFQRKVAMEIQNGPYGSYFECDAFNDPNPLVIVLPGHYNDDLNQDIASNNSPMRFSNAPEVVSGSQVFTSSLTTTLSQGTGTFMMSIEPQSLYGWQPFLNIFLDGAFGMPVEIVINPNVINRSQYEDTNRVGWFNWMGALLGKRVRDIVMAGDVWDFFIDYNSAIDAGFRFAADEIIMDGFTQAPATDTYGRWDLQRLNGTKLYLTPDQDHSYSENSDAITLRNAYITENITVSQQSGYLTDQPIAYPIKTGASIVGSDDTVTLTPPTCRFDRLKGGAGAASAGIWVPGAQIVAFSFPRQLSGDIAAQYTEPGQYEGMINTMLTPDSRWVFSNEGSVFHGKEFMTVVAYTNDETNTNLELYGNTQITWEQMADNQNMAFYRTYVVMAIVTNGSYTVSNLNESEINFTAFTITPSSANIINEPETLSVPYEGKGATHLVKANRKGLTTANSRYNLAFLNAGLTYITNAGDTSISVAEYYSGALNQTLSEYGLSSVTQISKSNVTDLSVVLTSGTYTLEAVGLVAAGFETNMIIHLEGSALNAGKRFYISGVIEGSGGAVDKLTINASAGNPYEGMGAPAAQGAQTYNLTGSAFKIIEQDPQPNAPDFGVSSSVEGSLISVNEFTNSGSEDNVGINNTSASVILKTKELDFEDIAREKSIKVIYITHSESSKISVKCITDKGTHVVLAPDTNSVSDSLSIVKYPVGIKNCRTIQLLLESTSAVTNYILNDITIVYREKAIK